MASKRAGRNDGDPPQYDGGLRKRLASKLSGKAVEVEPDNAVRLFRDELEQVATLAGNSPDRRALAEASLTSVIRLLNRLGIPPAQKVVFFELRAGLADANIGIDASLLRPAPKGIGNPGPNRISRDIQRVAVRWVDLLHS